MSDPGRRIGSYDVVGEIARGGMATVFLARQPSLGRSVALKRVDLTGDPTLGTRFVDEAEIVARLAHENIVTVYDFFEHDGVPFIAMEYVDGGSLRDRADSLTLPQVIGVLGNVLAALEYAEAHGIAHRDLKPDNLLVTGGGTVKVADFGLARAYNELTGRMTPSGVAMGTPAYMAPEQATGEPLSPATDLYAVGVIAYELLAGRPPFDPSDTPVAVLYRHVNHPAPALAGLVPDVDPAIADWVEWLLRKPPAERPAGASEAWEALEGHAVDLLGPYWRRSSRLPVVAPASGGEEYKSFEWPEARRPTEGYESEPAPPPTPAPTGPDEHVRWRETVPPPAAPPEGRRTTPPAAPPPGPPTDGGAPPTEPIDAPRLRRGRIAVAAVALVAAVVGAILLIGGEDPEDELATYRKELTSAITPLVGANVAIEDGLENLDDPAPADNNLKKVKFAREQRAAAEDEIAALTVPEGRAATRLAEGVGDALEAELRYLQALKRALDDPTPELAEAVVREQREVKAALEDLGDVVPRPGAFSVNELGKLEEWSRDDGIPGIGPVEIDASPEAGSDPSPEGENASGGDERAACENRRDDDGDHDTDHPDDPGCASPGDNDERNVVGEPDGDDPEPELCGNDKDDDGDLQIDEGCDVEEGADARPPGRTPRAAVA